jgi:hypothetical protein
MHQYRVVERWDDDKRCVFQCSNGRYHVARALHLMPPVQAPLRGEKPRLGFGILLCAATGAIFRVIFESVNEPKMAPGPGGGRLGQPMPG